MTQNEKSVAERAQAIIAWLQKINAIFVFHYSKKKDAPVKFHHAGIGKGDPEGYIFIITETELIEALYDSPDKITLHSGAGVETVIFKPRLLIPEPGDIENLAELIASAMNKGPTVEKYHRLPATFTKPTPDETEESEYIDAIDWFSTGMILRMSDKQNEGKTGWHDLPYEELLRYLSRNSQLIANYLGLTKYEEARTAALDVGNYAMMIYKKITDEAPLLLRKGNHED